MTITTDVPSSPWTLPTWTSGAGRPRRLFFTSANLTRFNNNWTNVAYCAPVVNQCINFQSQANNSPIVQALYYLHTGTASYATTAYTQAMAIGYLSAGYGLFGFGAHPAAFVLDWCYDALTPTQISNLVAKLDALCDQFETQFVANPAFHEHFKANNDSFLICAIAIQGEVGAQDRNTKIRNASQNWLSMFNEIFADGVHAAYPYQEGYWFHYWILYEIATGQTLSLDFMKARIEMICRQMSGDGVGQHPFEGDQISGPEGILSSGSNGVGTSGLRLLIPEWLGYTMGKYFNGRSGYLNQVWQWLGDYANATQGTGQSQLIQGWSYQNDSPAWLGMMFYDNAISRTAPQSAGFPLNRSGSTFRTAHFRSGWNAWGPSNVDVNVWFKCRPASAHWGRNSSGEIDVYRGKDDLLPRGATYIDEGGAGHGFSYYDGFYEYSYSANTITFCPTGSATPDTSGSQLPLSTTQTNVAGTRMAAGSTYFPKSNLYDRAAHYRNGEFTTVDLPTSGNGTYGMVWADLTECYEFSTLSGAVPGTPRVQACTRKICCIPGTIGKMTIIVREQFTLAAGAISAIKWGWFCRQQPTVSSPYTPQIVSGSTSGGVIIYTAAPVVIGASVTVALPATIGKTVGAPITATNSPTSWTLTDPFGYFTIDNSGQITCAKVDIPPQAYTVTANATNANGTNSAVVTITVTTTGTVYYCSTTGNDSNNGLTIGAPFKTFAHSVAVATTPGDCVLFRSGTYSPSSPFFTSHAGTAAHPIVLAAYNGETPIFSGANVTGNQAIVQLNADYISLIGITCSGGPSTTTVGIAVYHTTGTRVAQCTVHDCYTTGIWVGEPGFGSGNYVVDCIVHDNCQNNLNHALGVPGVGWGQGISLNSNSSFATENTSYNNWGEGIGIESATNSTIANNTAYDNYSIQIYPDDCAGAIIDSNIAWSTGDTRWGYLGAGLPDGIRLARERNASALSGIRVSNNIVIGTLYGISYYDYVFGGGMQSCGIYDNTLVNNGTGCVNFQTSASHSGNVVNNNIMYGQNPTGTTTGFTFNYNDWYLSTRTGGFVGANDKTSNPLFTGTAGLFVDTGYQVQGGSPCKLAGINRYAAGVTTDYGGNARPSGATAFTIGAWQ